MGSDQSSCVLIGLGVSRLIGRARGLARRGARLQHGAVHHITQKLNIGLVLQIPDLIDGPQGRLVLRAGQHLKAKTHRQNALQRGVVLDVVVRQDLVHVGADLGGEGGEGRIVRCHQRGRGPADRVVETGEIAGALDNLARRRLGDRWMSERGRQGRQRQQGHNAAPQEFAKAREHEAAPVGGLSASRPSSGARE